MNTTAHKHSKFQLLALRVLSNSRWLGNFPQEALQRLVDKGSIQKLSRGEVLSRRGQRIDALTVVLDGSLDVSITTGEG